MYTQAKYRTTNTGTLRPLYSTNQFVKHLTKQRHRIVHDTRLAVEEKLLNVHKKYTMKYISLFR